MVIRKEYCLRVVVKLILCDLSLLVLPGMNVAAIESKKSMCCIGTLDLLPLAEVYLTALLRHST